MGPAWLPVPYVIKDDLELLIRPPLYTEYRCVPPYQIYAVQGAGGGIGTQDFGHTSKHSIN